MNNQPVGCLLFILLAGSVCRFGPFTRNVDSVTVGTTDKNSILIPAPNTLLSMDNKKFTSMPFQVGMEALNRLCAATISGNSTQGKYTPNVTEMVLLLKRGNQSVTHPLMDPEILWKDPLFNQRIKLVVYVTGWLTDVANGNETSVSAEELFKAYSARGGYNFVVLDSVRFIDSFYSWSAMNTEEIGRLLSESLLKLVANYPVKNIHLIGHSLGGQIVGAAGRHFHGKTDKFLPRITGLDPANPCFTESDALTGLYRGDAEFVDIIHTNNGALGQKQPTGDTDFYPNGVGALQAGCSTIVCAHQRSWQLFAESVYPGNEENFLSTRCNSLSALTAKLCKYNHIPMGFACPSNLKGNFFLKTRMSYPYGEGWAKYIGLQN